MTCFKEHIGDIRLNETKLKYAQTYLTAQWSQYFLVGEDTSGADGRTYSVSVCRQERGRGGRRKQLYTVIHNSLIHYKKIGTLEWRKG
jgi:hypothetical protein